MSKLVIAEKPMLARDIARAITGKEVSESARLPISGNGYTVCACAGHLLELVKPDAIDPKWGMPWSLDVLPIEVHDWPKEPAVDKKTGESKKPLIDQIAGLLKTCDSVIAAGDPDDEGQLIVDELLDYRAAAACPALPRLRPMVSREEGVFNISMGGGFLARPAGCWKGGKAAPESPFPQRPRAFTPPAGRLPKSQRKRAPSRMPFTRLSNARNIRQPMPDIQRLRPQTRDSRFHLLRRP